MTDYAPHPLVTGVSKELCKKGEPALTALAEKAEQAANADEDAAADAEPPSKEEYANALAEASQLPELVIFAGYLGGVIERDADGIKWQLLYLDWRLSTWLLVQQEDIVFRKALEDHTAPFNKRDAIWVKANALITRGSGPQPVEARFLRGDFTRAGDVSASVTGGTFSPATGIFCEATTPSCCGRPTRR
jgi:hypothetical protein